MPVVARRRPGFSLNFGAIGAGVLAAALVATGAGAGTAVARAAADPAVPGASCLTQWATASGAARDGISGAGQFWTVRGLQAYAGDGVELVQVNSDLSVYPWLANLAPAESARVGYVVVAEQPDDNGHLDYWGDTVTDLGTPKEIVRCGRFAIYDYRGTAAEQRLTEAVTRSARVQAALRGFGVTS